tara:strand:- start:118 stop:2355 length:2238 start_codon:yes stop_codon:yes gene_type:complete
MVPYLGPWATGEDQVIKDEMAKDGAMVGKWAKVNALLPLRGREAIRERYKHLCGGQTSVRWTEAETRVVLDNVGTQWTESRLAELLPGRSLKSVYDHKERCLAPKTAAEKEARKEDKGQKRQKRAEEEKVAAQKREEVEGQKRQKRAEEEKVAAQKKARKEAMAKVCASCEQNLPGTSFTECQLSKGAARRCRHCVVMAEAEAERDSMARMQKEVAEVAAHVKRCQALLVQVREGGERESSDAAATLIREMAEHPWLGFLAIEVYAELRTRLTSEVERCEGLLRQLLGHRAPLSEQRTSLGVDSLNPESKFRPWLLGGAEREGALTLLASLAYEQAERPVLTAMTATSDETVDCMLQLLGATSASLVGSESASWGLPASLPRELSGRRRELLHKVIDHLCADVAANDGAAARSSHDRSVSLAALRRLLVSPDLPKPAQHHALGQLGLSQTEASLREIYTSLGVSYVQRWVNGQPWPPSASSLYLSDPSPLYTDFINGLSNLPVANLSRLKASMRKLLYDFPPHAIPSGEERRPSGSVVVGVMQACHLRDAQYAVVVDMEYTSDKGENLITGGRRCWWEGSVRLVDLRTGKTVESLCKTKPKDVGLDSDDIKAFKTRIKQYIELGYKIYNFSKGADSRFITHCAGLKLEEYDEVAVDFRALLGALTTFFHRSCAPNSMDIGRHLLGLPGPTEWRDSGRAKEEELDADQGVPHRAPMDTWQMGYEVYVLHLLLADASLPMWQLLPAP